MIYLRWGKKKPAVPNLWVMTLLGGHISDILHVNGYFIKIHNKSRITVATK